MSPSSKDSAQSTQAPVCTAVLGGTFDPVHLGHLHAAHAGRKALGVASVTLLPAARPWHRPAPVASIEQRWQMLGLAVHQEPGLMRSDLEIVRQGPTYTVDTLGALAGDAPVVWFIGGDALAAIGSWHRADELPALCHLLVFDRPGNKPCLDPPRGFVRTEDVMDLMRCPSGRIHYLRGAMCDISASGVRHAIAAGGDPSAWLPPRIWAYIQAHRLYGANMPMQHTLPMN